MHRLAWVILISAAVVPSLGGCASAPRADLFQRLQDSDPSVRIVAIQEAADQKNLQAAAYLIERLDDSEADVRFFAYIGLEKLTGQTMGYHYYDPPDARAAAIQRWRQWEAGKNLPQPTSRPKGNSAK